LTHPVKTQNPLKGELSLNWMCQKWGQVHHRTSG
jgi:hypothetical protein